MRGLLMQWYVVSTHRDCSPLDLILYDLRECSPAAGYRMAYRDGSMDLIIMVGSAAIDDKSASWL
jgi:hypothetical protein